MTARRTHGRFGVAAIVLALAVLPAAADFETGMSQLKAGKYLEAAAEFQAVVDEHPDYADGYHLLGVCFLKAKKYQDAEKNLIKAIELNGDNFASHYNLANAYRAQGKNDKVVKTMNNAEGLAAGDQKALVSQLRGNALAVQGKWAEAVDDLEKAAAAKPDAVTQAQLGKAYFAVGENDKAVSALRKALSMDKSAGNYELLVEAMLNVAAKTSGESAKKSKYGDALAEAEKFLAFAPSSTDAKYLVGRAALGAGQFDKSVGAFQDVLKAKSNHCNAMANMGKAHTAKGDWANALTSLENATRCDAGMSVAWEGMGFVLQKTASNSKEFAVQQKNYQQAIAAYKKAQAIKPSSSISKAIETCEHNLSVSQENQQITTAEKSQEDEIAAEEARLREEERKRKEWEAKQKDD
jgi:tetratricopeptide (TPR) repeat protein